MVNKTYVVINDITAVNVFATKYLKNEMLIPLKTALLCNSTHSPETPRADDITDILIISGRSLATQYLIPLVISSKHKINE